MNFGENRLSDYFVVTNLQDKKIDKFNIFKKEDWSSAYQRMATEIDPKRSDSIPSSKGMLEKQ